jgi:hypothetical protein
MMEDLLNKELQLCSICRVEFVKDKYDKNEKCEGCKDIDLCMECEEEHPTISMVENDYGDLICEECAEPKCRFCNEAVDEDMQFCSKSCVDGYKWDNFREKC